MNHHYIGEHEWGSVVWRLKLLCVQVSLDSQWNFLLIQIDLWVFPDGLFSLVVDFSDACWWLLVDCVLCTSIIESFWTFWITKSRYILNTVLRYTTSREANKAGKVTITYLLCKLTENVVGGQISWSHLVTYCCPRSWQNVCINFSYTGSEEFISQCHTESICELHSSHKSPKAARSSDCTERENSIIKHLDAYP